MSDIRAICEKIKGKSGAGAALVVTQALNIPGLFFYGQLYHTDEVQRLADGEGTKAAFDVVKLLSYGTHKDVDSLSVEAAQLLTPVVTAKLHYLTLVSLSTNQRRLTYEQLHASLGVEDVRELEDIVIDAITEGLIGGRIDQQNSIVDIHEVAARDVELTAVPALIEQLEAWAQRCDAVTSELKTVAVSQQNARDRDVAVAVARGDREAAAVVDCKKALLAGNKADQQRGDAGAAQDEMGGHRGKRGY
jgi:COP9 signalosome complex subunit 7